MDRALTCRCVPDRGNWYHVACREFGRCQNCGHYPVYSDSIVIAVDGGCRNNGTAYAEAAFAAYFNVHNTKYNESSLLEGPVQTNQRAELSAGLLALNIANNIKDLNDPSLAYGSLGASDPEADLLQVVIKSDSEYLVKGMASWIHRWKQNGFISAKGNPVVNADLFHAIDNAIEELYNRGVEVQFWHVPRDQNQVADYLVNCKLDGLTAEEAIERFCGTQA
jgi:ribonuclease HI